MTVNGRCTTFLRSSGAVDWYDEIKGSKLTGASKYSVSTSDGGHLYSIDCWMGPSITVPHLRLTFGMQGVHTTLEKDFVPRTAIPLGSDMNYLEDYFTAKESLRQYDDLVATSGATPAPPKRSFAARLLRSPLYLHLQDLPLDKIQAYSISHVDTWLQWIAASQPVDARQRGAINTRDDKLRQFAYTALLSEYRGILGGNEASGVKAADLAAAACGPISEAYVGGSS